MANRITQHRVAPLENRGEQQQLSGSQPLCIFLHRLLDQSLDRILPASALICIRPQGLHTTLLIIMYDPFIPDWSLCDCYYNVQCQLVLTDLYP